MMFKFHEYGLLFLLRIVYEFSLDEVQKFAYNPHLPNEYVIMVLYNS